MIIDIFTSNIIQKVNDTYYLSGGGYKIENKLYEEGIKEIDQIFEYLQNSGMFKIANTDLGYDTSKVNIQLDPSVVRGLEYYTGPVFEAEIAYQSLMKTDLQRFKKEIKIGSIGGGGRYDKLVSRFLKDDYPATGISIGLDRLLIFLKEKNKDQTVNNSPVIICVFNNQNFSKYNEILQVLRSSNINSEIYSGDGNLKSQMKYADKRNAPAVIFYGEDEIKSGKITVKNLKSGKENSLKVENLANEIKKLIWKNP